MFIRPLPENKVYKGLDIATNKATPKERGDIPHHLLDFVDPSCEYSVSEFERDALQAISQIHSRNKIPIIVGGTNYYIQTILFHNKIIPSHPTPGISSSSSPDTPHPSLSTHPLLSQITSALAKSDLRTSTEDEVRAYAQSDDMWKLLKEVDPGMAVKWHPRADRKIRRSLQMGLFQELLDMREKVLAGEVVGSTGSEQVSSFANQNAANVLSEFSESKGEETLVDDDNVSISSRTSTSSSDTKPQYTRGILQAIGFKEFHPYFTYLSSHPLPPADDPRLQELLAQGVEDMKRATRNYARRQVAWMRNRLVGMVRREMGILGREEEGEAKGVGTKAGIYLLDAGGRAFLVLGVLGVVEREGAMFHLPSWSTQVLTPSLTLTRTFLSSSPFPHPTSTSETASNLLTPLLTKPDKQPWRKYVCDVCLDDQGQKRVLNGPAEWEAHLRSKQHRKSTGVGRGRGRGRGGGEGGGGEGLNA
ncbi:hypothetical protein HDV00_005092 [Rhizophlyctis rosea]|nr:hypothetical protein HDV00_005092 [Rhizophlyctis rosea]